MSWRKVSLQSGAKNEIPLFTSCNFIHRESSRACIACKSTVKCPIYNLIVRTSGISFHLVFRCGNSERSWKNVTGKRDKREANKISRGRDPSSSSAYILRARRILCTRTYSRALRKWNLRCNFLNDQRQLRALPCSYVPSHVLHWSPRTTWLRAPMCKSGDARTAETLERVQTASHSWRSGRRFRTRWRETYGRQTKVNRDNNNLN